MVRVHGLLLLSLLIFLPLISAVGGGPRTAPIGGWTPIKNIKDPQVTNIASFAVTEHNQKSGEKLSLKEVIEGETQVVSGINYRLLLAAEDGANVNKYRAVVWEKPWLHFRNLTSFESYQG
ncbi:hypothetical protein L6164_032299 [Bauhinia variegata]|uniref:Uncharacterized protein n=1 Tax=Bauhinia variegata TaxID=167791 RepID=A0ACB9KN46_BAUVA|nr:hypothetical protein L6164_032299 [Bauhinia variegata]